MHHVAKEVGLPGLTEAADPNVREELLLEDVFGILDSLLPGHSRLGPTNTNEIESHVLLLNNKGLIQRGLELEEAVEKMGGKVRKVGRKREHTCKMEK